MSSELTYDKKGRSNVMATNDQLFDDVSDLLQKATESARTTRLWTY